MKEMVKNKQEVLKPETLLFLENSIGKVKEIKPISGGLVHHVFKVKSVDNHFYYLKIRTSNTAVQIDGMNIKPDEMIYEREATNKMHNLEPDTFPQVVAEDSKNGIILLSDIMPSGDTLIDILKKDLIDDIIVSNIASKIGEIHSKVYGLNINLRGDNENQFFRKLLDFRYGYQNHPIINQLIFKLSNNPNGLIIGGLSPKNIVIRNDKTVGICDLETVCNGNQLFDVSFCLGHLMAHNLSEPEKLLVLTELFQIKYKLDSNINIDTQDFVDLTLVTILYRTRNTSVTYNIGLSSEVKEKVSNIITYLIDSRANQWSEIIKQLNQSIYEQ